MKILMINKFLYPNGGSETYIFQLGKLLEKHGHEVQYFGMEHEGRIVGNRVHAYTSKMDFHTASTIQKLSYPFKIIHSKEAAEKIRLVLDDFQPDVCHLNNFNFQLTPSVISAIRRWEKDSGHKVRIIYTAHDYQLVCPNHMLYNETTRQVCEKCLNQDFSSCVRDRCMHGSRAQSILGAYEAAYWKKRHIYREIDCIVCPSAFMKTRLDRHPDLAGRTVVLHNFVTMPDQKETEHEPSQNPDTESHANESGASEKESYVLYFGRFSEEKGIRTLLAVCRALPDIPFVFAGKGPLEEEVNQVSNVRNVGFQTGDALESLIRRARFSIYPSEWYENCPYSVMESQICGTPVLAADIGGIPELVQDGKTGELFRSGDSKDLKQKTEDLWNSPQKLEDYTANCSRSAFPSEEEYYKNILSVYQGA